MPLVKDFLAMLRDLPEAELLWASVREVPNISRTRPAGATP